MPVSDTQTPSVAETPLKARWSGPTGDGPLGERDDGTNQTKLFFHLRRVICALDQDDMPPDQVKLIPQYLGVTEQDVIDMNRWLGGDVPLNSLIREVCNSGEWIDWPVDESVSQEIRITESERSEHRRKALDQMQQPLESTTRADRRSTAPC
jgi:RNA polymerase sigma-32 factor